MSGAKGQLSEGGDRWRVTVPTTTMASQQQQQPSETGQQSTQQDTSMMIDETSSISSSQQQQRQQRIERSDLKRYQGAMTRTEAERRMRRRNDFIIYHLRSCRDFESLVRLPLMVAYRSSKGDYHHYPIKRIISGTTALYCVGKGPANPPSFSSLQALCDYYEASSCSCLPLFIYLLLITSAQLDDICLSAHVQLWDWSCRYTILSLATM